MRLEHHVGHLPKVDFAHQIAGVDVVEELLGRRAIVVSPVIFQLNRLGDVRETPTVDVTHRFLNFVQGDSVQVSIAAPFFDSVRDALFRDRILILILAVSAVIPPATLVKISSHFFTQRIDSLHTVESAKFPAFAVEHSACVRIIVRGLVADRKSTRLNSSHSQISYAVFCLKKKKKTNETPFNTTLCED